MLGEKNELRKHTGDARHDERKLVNNENNASNTMCCRTEWTEEAVNDCVLQDILCVTSQNNLHNAHPALGGGDGP